MGISRRLLIWLSLSHVTALGLGWLVIKSLQDEPEGVVDSTQIQAQRNHEGARGSDARVGFLQRLQVIAKDNTANSMARLSPEPKPAADREGSAIEALTNLKNGSTSLREAAFRLAHWMEEDREAAMSFLRSAELSAGTVFRLFQHEDADGITRFFTAAELIGELGQGGVLVNERGRFDLSFISRKIAEEGNPFLIEELADQTKGYRYNRLIEKMVKHWPSGQVARLEPFLIAQFSGDQGEAGSTSLVFSAANHLPPERRLAWIESLAKISPELKARMEAGDTLQSFVNRGFDLPWQDRYEMTRSFLMTKGQDKEVAELNAYGHLAFYSINYRLSFKSFGSVENPAERDALHDWRNRLKTGQLTLDDMKTEIGKMIPEVVSDHPEFLNEKLFREVFDEAPEDAAKLLDGPFDDARRHNILVSSVDFMNRSPQAYYEVLRSFEPTHPKMMNPRFGAWGKAIEKGFDHYGSSYIKWAKELPVSVDRDMALSVLALKMDKIDPGVAEELRSEKTYKSGWRPGL